MSPVKQSASTVVSSVDGPRATIRLARPPVNVINGAMMDEIAAAAEAVAKSDAKLLVLRGDGRCFSAGADVEEHLPREVPEMLRRFRHVATALAELPIPTLVYAHGACLGGALEIALVADFIYAAPGTKLGQPEIVLGVMPPLAAAYLPSQIGLRRTNDLLLSGRTITAEEAASWGLINGVADEAAFEQVVASIAKKSRPALLATKRAIAKGRTRGFDAALRDAIAIYLDELMKSDDPVEGLKAFLEKREPRFTDK